MSSIAVKTLGLEAGSEGHILLTFCACRLESFHRVWVIFVKKTVDCIYASLHVSIYSDTVARQGSSEENGKDKTWKAIIEQGDADAILHPPLPPSASSTSPHDSNISPVSQSMCYYTI